MSLNKYSWKVNKPKKITNEKSGYTSKQETTPDRPVTIYYAGKKVADIYGTIKTPKTFAAQLVSLLNEDEQSDYNTFEGGIKLSSKI